MAQITLQDCGKTLTFNVRKMPATAAEDWLLRALFLTGKGSDLAGLQDVGGLIRALCQMPYDDAKDLLDRLLSCCWKVDGKQERQVTTGDADGYISSPLTLLKLRVEAAKENFGFFTDGTLSTFLSASNGETSAQPSGEQPNTRTYRR